MGSTDIFITPGQEEPAVPISALQQNAPQQTETTNTPTTTINPVSGRYINIRGAVKPGDGYNRTATLNPNTGAKPGDRVQFGENIFLVGAKGELTTTRTDRQGNIIATDTIIRPHDPVNYSEAGASTKTPTQSPTGINSIYNPANQLGTQRTISTQQGQLPAGQTITIVEGSRKANAQLGQTGIKISSENSLTGGGLQNRSGIDTTRAGGINDGTIFNTQTKTTGARVITTGGITNPYQQAVISEGRPTTAGTLIRQLQGQRYEPARLTGDIIPGQPNTIVAVKEGNTLNTGANLIQFSDEKGKPIGEPTNKLIIVNEKIYKDKSLNSDNVQSNDGRRTGTIDRRPTGAYLSNTLGQATFGEQIVKDAIRREKQSTEELNNLFGLKDTPIGANKEYVESIGRGIISLPSTFTASILGKGESTLGAIVFLVENKFSSNQEKSYSAVKQIPEALPILGAQFVEGTKKQITTGEGQGQLFGTLLTGEIVKSPFPVQVESVAVPTAESVSTLYRGVTVAGRPVVGITGDAPLFPKASAILESVQPSFTLKPAAAESFSATQEAIARGAQAVKPSFTLKEEPQAIVNSVGNTYTNAKIAIGNAVQTIQQETRPSFRFKQEPAAILQDFYKPNTKVSAPNNIQIGRVAVGYPALDLSTADFSGDIRGYRPESVAQTEIIKRNLAGVTGETEASKIQLAQQVMRTTEHVDSSFLQKKFIDETKTLTPAGVRDVVNFAKENKGTPYGSFAARPQLPASKARVPGDIDLQFDSDTATVEKKIPDLLKKLKASGNEVRQSPTKSTLIEVKGEDGTWHHAIDIHTKDTLSAEVSSGQAVTPREFGFSTQQKLVNIEGIPTQRLSEQGVKKGGSILAIREGTPIDHVSTEPAIQATNLFVNAKNSDLSVRTNPLSDLKYDALSQNELHITISKDRNTALTNSLEKNIGNAPPVKFKSGVYDASLGNKKTQILLLEDQPAWQAFSDKVRREASLPPEKSIFHVTISSTAEGRTAGIADITQATIKPSEGKGIVLRPAPHRAKDIPDFFAVQETLLESKKLPSPSATAALEELRKLYPEAQVAEGKVTVDLGSSISKTTPTSPASTFALTSTGISKNPVSYGRTPVSTGRIAASPSSGKIQASNTFEISPSTNRSASVTRSYSPSNNFFPSTSNSQGSTSNTLPLSQANIISPGSNNITSSSTSTNKSPSSITSPSPIPSSPNRSPSPSTNRSNSFNYETPTNKIGNITSPPKKKKPKEQIQQQGNKLFRVSGRRDGKFFQIAQPVQSEQQAVSLGRRFAESTLGASFKIESLGGGGVNFQSDLASLGGKFRAPKRGGEIFIQESKYRLSSSQEKQEIQSSKRSRSKKNMFGGGTI